MLVAEKEFAPIPRTSGKPAPTAVELRRPHTEVTVLLAELDTAGRARQEPPAP